MEITLTQFVAFACRMSDWHGVNNHHDERVASLAVMIGQQLDGQDQLDSARLVLLKHAAALHDIGRVGVDNAIMTKPGPLTASEYAAVREHSQIGYNLVKDILPLEIAEGILHHHERWDGTGYPHYLRGVQIPLFARIICIADYYDALRNPRPYRGALEIEQALHIMNQDMTHFDPHLYSIFLRMIRETERGR